MCIRDSHREALELIVKTLTDKDLGVISSMSEIAAVGHRVLHGGEKFSGSVLVNEDVINAIIECKMCIRDSSYSFRY